MKTKKGEGSGSKTALNYGKQGRQTANKNKAAMQLDPCNNSARCMGQMLVSPIAYISPVSMFAFSRFDIARTEF